MIDDLIDYRATMLVWAALGGGSLSLPYLEQEAWQGNSPRFRLYGFVNDSEFIAECRKHGIRVLGIVGTSLEEPSRRALFEHRRTIRLEHASAFEPGVLPMGPQVSFDPPIDAMVNLVRLERGAAVHIIRYDQEEAIDSVPVLPSLEMRVRLPRPFFNVTAVSPDGNLKARVHTAGGEHRLTLRDVPLYCILWLR